MITIQQANITHVNGIISVCQKGYWATYQGLLSDDYIERVCEEFYNEARVTKEVQEQSKHWGGYVVALDGEEVVGAAGGGLLNDVQAELFVLYLLPNRRNEGIGSKLLAAITEQQRSFGATEQWVSVAKNNDKGIPFYEARGFRFQYEQAAHGNDQQDEYKSCRYRRVLT
ncbi:GNAT family N-acetyltransferase [Alkalihalobacillus sp. LMS6]|uniref:GNAT family N-acetyltransferase n=1 Tax=Alkalihalobacillus sp. LMS6 TaxID=2924034 RepID=UPI0020D07D93|nr:GNAT family N-acetyltransferase [Alkalihalobacillus sp. LMS6]UTR06007.1 GNAT family N-acetyltransferase [Alkalihalobacillus sp. LMS6]